MKTAATLTYLQQNNRSPILDRMEVDLTVADNPLSIPPPALFEMAARVNKKRGFLFVSKVLGKHIPVSPLKPLLASGLLAIEYAEKTSGLRIDGKDEVTAGFLAEDHESIKKLMIFSTNSGFSFRILRLSSASQKRQPLLAMAYSTV